MVIQRPCGVDSFQKENAIVAPAAAPTTDCVTTEAFSDVEEVDSAELVDWEDSLLLFVDVACSQTVLEDESSFIL